MIFSIILTIFLTYLIWNEFENFFWLNILFSACIAPVLALSLAEIIGRLRVFKTFVYKIDSYNLSDKNMEIYKSDLEDMFKAYNALISKINEVVEEN